MKIALDPYMLRGRPLPEVIRMAAEICYQYIELSPRDDFLPFFVYPRADSSQIALVKKALAETGVEIASVLPLYRWSGPDEDARAAAVRCWKRAIEITVELGCEVMNSEFNGRPEDPTRSEEQFWRSLDTLLPILAREGTSLHLEAHPDDFCERNTAAVDIVRAVDRPTVNYLYHAPHTFHLDDGVGDVAAMLDYAAAKLAHLHIADSYNHRASSGLRYIVNPPGSTARVHQHLDIGEGEVDWATFFDTLRRSFDGIVTVCVFAWEERAIESSISALTRITKELVPA